MESRRCLACVLKERGRRISELETLVVRQSSTIHGTFDALENADPLWDEAAPSGDRVSRKELIHAADQYFNGIEQGDGQVVPFADDCIRIENGGVTAPKAATANQPRHECAGAVQYEDVQLHPRGDRSPFRNRRSGARCRPGIRDVPASGQHQDANRPSTGTGSQAFPLSSYPNTTQIMEVFRVRAERSTTSSPISAGALSAEPGLVVTPLAARTARRSIRKLTI